MKGILKKALFGCVVIFWVLSAGCFWYEGSDLDEDCCSPPPPPPCCAPVEEWYALTDWYTLEVGEECAGGCGLSQCSGCTGCCTWYDEDWAIDTLAFNWMDEDLVDLQFHFVLTNWTRNTVPVWVSLCDDLGCEDVLYFDLLPGEVYEDQVINPVLDTALADLQDCFSKYGNFCYMTYDIEVDLGQECICAPVTLDYFYNGLYVY